MKPRATAYTSLTLGVLALVLLVAVLIAAWSTVIILAHLLLWCALVALSITAISWGSYRLIMGVLNIAERRQALRHAEEKHELERELALTRLAADQLGNYPVLLPQQALRIAPMMFTSGNSPHAPRLGTKITEDKQEPAEALLVSPQVRQPSQRMLLGELEPNMLQVCPGVRASTGEPVILSIEDAVHFKLIGSSGFGKSCLAGALIEQAITLNAPELLQIALLDLEHKTSRLFEDSPNVATLQVGRRNVPMVATNADEVALYLGHLKSELDRRARLTETDLQDEPILLIYVEEMLSLQYEVDEKLLNHMLADLSVLAVRARKYRMPLLACAQTDYSTPDLKTAQKQFRTRIAFAVDATAARAAGFMSTDLIKYNFTNSQQGDGQFVLEAPGIASLMLAPVYDVKQKLLSRESGRKYERSRSDSGVFTPSPPRTVNSERTHVEQGLNGSQNTHAHPLQAKGEEVQRLQSLGWLKIAIIEKVWNVKRGGSQRWKDAEANYNQIIAEQAVESEA